MQDGSICQGVRIEDMGHKMGCNGVDNGKLWFDGETCASCLDSGHCVWLEFVESRLRAPRLTERLRSAP